MILWLKIEGHFPRLRARSAHIVGNLAGMEEKCSKMVCVSHAVHSSKVQVLRLPPPLSWVTIHSQHLQQAQVCRKYYKAQHLELDSLLSWSTGALSMLLAGVRWSPYCKLNTIMRSLSTFRSRV